MSVVFFLQNIGLKDHQSGLNMPQVSFIWTYFNDKYWCDSRIKIPFKEYLKRKKKVSRLPLFIHRVITVWSPPIPQTLLTQPNPSMRSREGVKKGAVVTDMLNLFGRPSLAGRGKGCCAFWGGRNGLRLEEKPKVKREASVCFRSTCPTSMHSACRKHFKRTFQVWVL